MPGNQLSFKECNLISYGQLGSHISSSPLFFNLLLSITQKGNLPTDVLSPLFLKWSTIWEAVIHSFYSRIPGFCLFNVTSFFFFFSLSLGKNKVLYALHLFPWHAVNKGGLKVLCSKPNNRSRKSLYSSLRSLICSKRTVAVLNGFSWYQLNTLWGKWQKERAPQELVCLSWTQSYLPADLISPDF